MNDEIIDIGLITTNSTIIPRIQEISVEFKCSFKRFLTLDEFIKHKAEIRLIIAFLGSGPTVPSPAEAAQGARITSPESFIVLVAEKSLPKGAASFAKQSGADIVLLEDEIYNTGKLEFITTQILRASHSPIKANDLVPNRVIPFDIYHLLPQRRKFLKFLFEGDSLDETKLKKLAAIKEVYIARSQISAYKKYIKENNDNSSAGRDKKCRIQFLALCEGFSKLVFQLTDQSEQTSFGEGERLMLACRQLCKELSENLSDFTDISSIINSSVIGEFGSVERAPAIASYVALFCTQCGFENVEQIMLAALLSELGLLFLPPALTKKLRDNKESEFTEQEANRYSKYPLESINIMLDRKLSVGTRMRNIMISTNENADGSGFPRHLTGAHIPAESQIIHLCRELDRRSLLRLGQSRLDPAEVRKKLINESTGLFSSPFLEKIQEGLKASQGRNS